MLIRLIDHGSIVGLEPIDDGAEQFLQNVGASDWQFMGKVLMLDQRVARDFIDQAINQDGVEFTA